MEMMMTADSRGYEEDNDKGDDKEDDRDNDKSDDSGDVGERARTNGPIILTRKGCR